MDVSTGPCLKFSHTQPEFSRQKIKSMHIPTMPTKQGSISCNELKKIILPACICSQYFYINITCRIPYFSYFVFNTMYISLSSYKTFWKQRSSNRPYVQIILLSGQLKLNRSCLSRGVISACFFPPCFSPADEIGNNPFLLHCKNQPLVPNLIAFTCDFIYSLSCIKFPFPFTHLCPFQDPPHVANIKE